jgi:hypothetical protein
MSSTNQNLLDAFNAADNAVPLHVPGGVAGGATAIGIPGDQIQQILDRIATIVDEHITSQSSEAPAPTPTEAQQLTQHQRMRALQRANRYHTPVRMTFIMIAQTNGGQTSYNALQTKDFSDVQMAYLFVEQHVNRMSGHEWDIADFHTTANHMESRARRNDNDPYPVAFCAEYQYTLEFILEAE